VLNSVSVSTTLVNDRLKNNTLANLSRAAAMLREQNGNLAEFLTTDPKGRVLPDYLMAAMDHLVSERQHLLQEVQELSQNVEHIKQIVAMQQNYAKVAGAFEHLTPNELVEDALRMNAAAFERHRVKVVLEYSPSLPKVRVDRHKVLQILINLIRNAKYAMDSEKATDKRLVVKVEPTDEGMVAVHICDNGMGIAPENLTRIFQHGFTTRKEGHGFGLHSGANAARELGGRLSARSDGLGQGATFTLELPVARNGNGASAESPAEMVEAVAG
jgi:signal transduction histidine kinase